MDRWGFSLLKILTFKIEGLWRNPRRENELQPLLYTFHRAYPNKLWSKYRWFRNSRLPSLLPSLNKRKRWLTVVDRLGAPGDALITANVIRCIKENYPKLRINCITPNPELIRLDPHIDSINQPESFLFFRFILLGANCSKGKTFKCGTVLLEPLEYSEIRIQGKVLYECRRIIICRK